MLHLLYRMMRLPLIYGMLAGLLIGLLIAGMGWGSPSFATAFRLADPVLANLSAAVLVNYAANHAANYTVNYAVAAPASASALASASASTLVAEQWHLAAWLQRLTAPMLVLALPVAIVWGRRQQLLQMNQTTLSTDWLGYLRLLNGITLSVWSGWLGLGWLGLGLASWAGEILSPLAERQPNLLHLGLEAGLEVGLFVLPPVGVIAGCYALSYRLFVRVGSPVWTKADLVQQVIWGQLRGFLPLALFFSGCRLFFAQQLFAQQPTLAMALFGAAYWSQLLLTQLSDRSHDLASQAVTAGELRDRIFALAEAAKVDLKQIYIMPSAKGRIANAFAFQGGNVVLTEPLLRTLNCGEIDAVMAHELAHLQYRHPQRLQVILLTALIGTVLSHSLLTLWFPNLPVVPLGLLLLPAYYHCSRQFEYAADRQAAQLCNPTAMITGLVKLAQITGTPLDWGKRGWMITHPSIQQRIEAIGRCHNMTITPEILSHRDSVPELNSELASAPKAHYSVPAGSTVFSSAFKQRTLQRLPWFWAGALLLPPALLVAWSRSQIWTPNQIGGQALVGLGAVLLSRVVANRLPLWGYAQLRQQLKLKLEQQGVNLSRASFVGLAPDLCKRYYEGLPHWDLGFLVLQGEQLCYLGEQTQFSLPLAQIQLLDNSQARQQAASLVIHWQSRAESGLFQLQVCEAQSLRQMQTATSCLKRQIERWQTAARDAQISAGVEPGLPALGLPQISRVTSQSYRDKICAQACDYLLKLAAMLLGLSLIAHLSWQQAGSLIYLLLVSLAGVIWEFMPDLRAISHKALCPRTVKKPLSAQQ